jgi:hypothetical protein
MWRAGEFEHQPVQAWQGMPHNAYTRSADARLFLFFFAFEFFFETDVDMC